MADNEKAKTLARIMQTEAQFNYERSLVCVERKKLVKAKNNQVLSAYWAKRARQNLFALIGARSE